MLTFPTRQFGVSVSMFSCLCSSTYKMHMSTSLVQCLNVRTPNAGDLGSNPGPGTRAPMPRPRGCLPQGRPSRVRRKEKPVCTLYVHTYSVHIWKYIPTGNRDIPFLFCLLYLACNYHFAIY